MIEERLKEMGIDVMAANVQGQDNRVGAVRVGNLVFVSGNTDRRPDGTRITGKVGGDVTVEQAYESAKWTAINALGALKECIGDLDKVKQIVKLTCMVNTAEGYSNTSAVANGASDFLVELFGERGKHARTSIGVATPAANACVQTEMIVEVE